MGGKRNHINGVKITNLRFADDVLIAKNRKELDEMLEELETHSRKGKLKMNIQK